MSKVFLIPGLGADCRIYQKIDFGECEIVKVDWIKPELSDTLITYAQKLINQYNIIDDSIVIGNSMGGMIAIEIGKKIACEKVILISSIRTADEAPGYFNFFRNIPLYKLIPENKLASFDYFLDLFFGRLEKQDLGLFRSMLKTWQPEFLLWSINAILKWDNKIIPENTFLITGDKDQVFPYQNAHGAIIVHGGTHMMIFDKAAETSAILKVILNNGGTEKISA